MSLSDMRDRVRELEDILIQRQRALQEAESEVDYYEDRVAEAEDDYNHAHNEVVDTEVELAAIKTRIREEEDRAMRDLAGEGT